MRGGSTGDGDDEAAADLLAPSEGSRASAEPISKPFYFRWRNTFIEAGVACGSDDESNSPRASSAPDRMTSSAGESFSSHRMYVDNLSDRMTSVWSARTAELEQQTATAVSVTSEDRDLNDELVVAASSPTPASTSSSVPIETQRLCNIAARAELATHNLHSGMTRLELREHMGKKALEVNETLRGRTWKQAMEAIEELPEQVEEVLQQKLTTVLEEVQGKVAAIQEIVRVEQESAGHQKVAQAMESLEAIPSIIQDNFESNAAKAKVTIRHRVNDMKESVRTGHFVSNKEIVAQIRSLPMEVQRIAAEALEIAKDDAKAQARTQLENALQKLPAHVSEVVTEPVPLLPLLPLDAGKAAAQVAAEPVEKAVAMAPHEEELLQVVANQVVADFLLRAKTINKENALLMESALPEPLHTATASARQWVGLAELKKEETPQRGRQKERSSDAVAERPREQAVLQLLNAGSLGHPDLCARPCLYYAAGDCKNGACCDFCHFEHPRRPTHLDKRHRELLQQLPVEDCMPVLLPVLRRKVQTISNSPRAVAMVDSLATTEPPQPPSGGRNCRRSSRALATAMEGMSLRMFLASLHRSVLAESPRRKQILDDILCELREDCLRRQGFACATSL